MGVWRKAENEDGFAFYVNEETQAIQWDHPKYVDVKQAIDDCNYVTYAAYRLALKFRVLQRHLHTEELLMAVVNGVFERHRLGNNESTLTLETCDLEAVLSDIYFATNKMHHMNIDVDFATELMMCFLYNVFDSKRKYNIEVSSAKILMGILSHSSLLDVYKFLFHLCRDHNNCVTRVKLRNLLSKICQVAKYLHENENFGQHLVNAAVEECFQSSPGLVGITESAFVSWMESSPKILSWIPILHRIKAAETVVHSAKCSSCRTKPLLGLRYECVKCSRYTQCQKCFFTGRISHSHKLSHLVREYCRNDSNKGNSTELAKRLCTLFCPKQTKDSDFEIVNPTSYFKDKLLKLSPSIDFCEVEPLAEPQTQLQAIIRQLEAQNRELQQIIILGSYSDKEMKKYLEEYRVYMAGQIKKLKKLKLQVKNQSTIATPEQNERMNSESTPMVRAGHVIKRKNIAMDHLSPIAQASDVSEQCYKTNIDQATYTQQQEAFKEHQGQSNLQYEMEDMSTWIGGVPQTPTTTNFPAKKPTFIPQSPVKVLHNDLDDALAKLQQILANNFSLDDASLTGMTDNVNLKTAVTEVEGMLTSIIDNVEMSRCNSAQHTAQPLRLKFDGHDLIKTAV